MLFQIDLPPQVLFRGFWIYAWKITGPRGERFCYVGMTGDVSGVAQSPFVRAGAHLGFNKNNNALRRLLSKHGVQPERCRELKLLVYGPPLGHGKGDQETRHQQMGQAGEPVLRQLRSAGATRGRISLLKRVRVPVDGTLFRASYASYEAQPRDGHLLVD